MSAMSVALRPMLTADVPAAARVAAAAFEWDLDQAELERPGAIARWQHRLAHPLGTDPDGCFVAVVGERVVGVAEAIVRESLWVLSLLTVDPGVQSGGAGRALMAAALDYKGPWAGAAHALSGLIVASNDPRALRLYGRAGFDLLPVFRAEGAISPERLHELSGPAAGLMVEIEEIHDPAQLAVIDGVTRTVRGAAWGPELRDLLDGGGAVLALPGRGLVALDGHGGHGIWGLAAADAQAARALLLAGLARCVDLPQVQVRWLTAAQDWAIPLLLELRLPLHADGAICVRAHPGTLAPYIPSSAYA